MHRLRALLDLLACVLRGICWILCAVLWALLNTLARLLDALLERVWSGARRPGPASGSPLEPPSGLEEPRGWSADGGPAP